jgi:uncharacterized membrane protein YeaQ/YmgE (transglycosylase-associated protein family)
MNFGQLKEKAPYCAAFGTPVPQGPVMTIDAQTILIILVVGLIAGWLASFVVGGAGAVRYLVMGLLGAIVGSYLFAALNIRMPFGDPFISQVVVAAIGAIVLVLIARLIARA